MPHVTHRLLTGAAVLTLSLSALAQSDKPAQPTPPAAPETPKPAAAAPAGKVDPEATKLLDSAKAAAKKATDLTAVVESEMKGEGAPPKMKGKVVATFKNMGMFPLGTWRIDRLPEKPDDKSPQLVMAFDGKLIQTINHQAKELQTMEAPMGIGMPMTEDGMLLPMWYVEQRQDMMGLDRAPVVEQSLQPDKEIGGVKCRVVREIREMPMPADPEEGDGGAAKKDPPKLVVKRTLFLGAEDTLARRVETTMQMTGGDDDGARDMVQTFTELKVNTKPDAALFTLTAPEGYATKKIEPDQGQAEEPSLKFKEGDAAPDFALKDADGKEHTLSEFKGKVLLLDFWATWCGPCKAAMPSIQKLHEKFKDKPVAVYGVNTWERKEGVGPKYMKDHNFTYGCLLKGDELAKAYGISGIPTVILIDPQGKIVFTTVGFAPEAEEKISDLIEEKLKAAK